MPLQPVQLPAVTAPLPLFLFLGRVETAATSDQVDAVVRHIYAEQPAAVGWDIEWCVNYQPGAAPPPVALLQFALACRPPVCYLLQLAHTGVTPSLRALLEDASVLKAGVGANTDAQKVTRDFGIHCRGVVELSDLASRVIAPPQRWSLAALVAHVFKRQVPKPPGVRLGKWDARVLSREQESYAALDAWASLRLHTQLRALPLLPPPEPPPELQVEQLQGCAASTAVTSAVAAPAALSHAKQGVLEMHLAGLTVPQIAAARGIKPVTVENYLAEALVAGHGYFWHLLGVPDAALALNDAAVASEPSDAPAQAAAGAATDADAALRGRMKELKARLPEWISFSFIRLALAHRDREATSENHGQ